MFEPFLNNSSRLSGRVEYGLNFEEFDPGSERTLAAWLRHASRGVKMIRSNTVKHDRRKGE